jgi:lactate dehydrogenase-like 2-hydroxyacid dehydrogenase
LNEFQPSRIVVSKRLPGDALGRLAEAGHAVWINADADALAADELARRAAGADAILVQPPDRVDADLLDAVGPQLQIVANCAVGYENVDVVAASTRGITVTNTAGVLADATADLTIGIMIAAMRGIVAGDRLVRRGDHWTAGTATLRSEVHGATLGIVGMGEIGRAVARRARAFDLRVLFCGSRHVPDEVRGQLELEECSLEDLLKASDVVSLHCPLTEATRHLIDAEALRHMRPEAFLVNAARGPVVDESALVEALRCGAIAGAALDVYEREPELHPGLVELDNVVLTPHIGSATARTRAAMTALAVDNVLTVLAGEPPLTPVPAP